MSSLKTKVVKGTIWALAERFAGQAVSFVVSMVLARLLVPEDYGTVALLGIFTAIAGVIVDSGLGGALIQKKEATELDFNSVFYLSLAASGAVYLILFFSAPFIADFYKTPVLIPITRVVSLTIIFNAINSVQNAELSRKMLFDRSFRISLISVVLGSAIGISLAYLGYGPWAIVWSTVGGAFVGVISRWFIIAWRPKLMFSWLALRGLWRFGWKMAVSSLLDSIFVNVHGLIIGRLYSKADLAFVNKGAHVPRLGMDSINSTLGRVAYPALAQMQDDPDKMREAMRKMIRISTFFVFPLMTGLAVCAKEIILILFGQKWLPAVPYLQIACFGCALWPFHTINLQGITAMGRSDVFLVLEIIKKTLCLMVIAITARSGVFVFVASSTLILGPVSVLINSWPNRKLLGYTIGMQLKDVASGAVMCVIAGGLAWGAGVLLSAECCGLGHLGKYSSAFVLAGIKAAIGMVVISVFVAVFRPVAFCEIMKLRRK